MSQESRWPGSVAEKTSIVQSTQQEWRPAKARSTTTLDLSPGAKIGKYRIERELGRGGQGSVLLARDEILGRLVAIKTVALHAYLPEDALKRFRNEARAIARLKHPNIVELFEAFDINGQPFLVMEYVEGTSLIEAVRRKQVSRQRVIEIAAQVCEAIGHAHAQGLVHRDLKPHNIMLTAEGTPKIMDFGLVRSLKADAGFTVATMDGQVVGSPAYMSPEQASGAAVGPATDIYAIGTLLYQCLSDTLPFGGDTPAEVMFRIIHEEPEALLRRDPTVGEDLSAIVMKAIEKAPEARYATSLAMAADLRCYLRHDAIQARPATVTARMRKAIRRNADMAILSGAALTFMAITVTVSLMLFARQSAAHVASGLQTELRSIANTAAIMFPQKDLDRIRSRADETDGAFRRTVASLNEIRRRNPRIANAFILRASGDRLCFVADADSFLGTVSAKRYPGAEWPVPSGSAAWKGLTQAVADTEPLSTPWGKCWTGYAPVRDPNGRAEAVLVLQMGADRFATEMRPALRTTVQVGSLATLLFMGFTGLAATRVLRRKRYSAV